MDKSKIRACKGCGLPWDIFGHEHQHKDSKYTDYRCKSCDCRRKPEYTDPDLVTHAVKEAKSVQGYKDRLRIGNKNFREYARKENAYTEYVKNLDYELKELGERIIFKTQPSTPPLITVRDKEVGVIQISDTHFNELINIGHNVYDIGVASKRLKLLVEEAIWTFTARGIAEVAVIVTGDLLNSDRRVDERYTQATNRAKATVISAELMTRVLLHVAEYFEVQVVSVLGNESRADKDMSWGNDVASNNYDFTIMAFTKKMLHYAGLDDRIKFGPIDQMEVVVDVNGRKILATHDINKATKEQKDTQSTFGRYQIFGTYLDMIMGGHLHAAKNGSFSIRSGSLAGSNAFNELGLGLAGWASQNLGIAGKDYFHTIAVDLQNIPIGYEGYDIHDDLMAYHAKSADKLATPVSVYTTFQ